MVHGHLVKVFIKTDCRHTQPVDGDLAILVTWLTVVDLSLVAGRLVVDLYCS
jgi:hypothetical protein